MKAAERTAGTGRTTAALELVCFPPAGGSAAAFRRWQAALGPDITVRAIDRRGDGAARIHGTSLTGIAASLAPLVARRTPYALVGHSLGGLLAYETALRICGRPELPRPRFVLVAGARPPHRSSAAVFAPLLELADDDLLDALAELGAVNPVLRTTPLKGLFLPALRADLALIAGYHPDPGAPPLPVDLLAWHAEDDALATPALGREWRRYTAARFEHTAFPGGHFFLQERFADVAAALRTRCAAG
ncbi:thioesterase II family protein [Thermostaphylospora chromogena]|uniref:Surfactin synthase thioesterase subunit n=1 Tax=Thermostaphylospora chromogena TaxID=35622 RepID=A0A1H1HBU8_9ACTN|nr:alpha/beta fold hydrolase [Thermostaphylospora chromogena]SDR22536.1 Surfactin synthase thioesterase subunit [Thermostaphylospora chromogena]